MATACTANFAAQAAWASCIHKIDIGEVPGITEIAPLCSSGLLEVLVTLLYEQLEAQLETVFVKKFWQQLQPCQQSEDQLQSTLLPALQELAGAVQQQSEQLSAVAQQLLLTVVQKHKQQQQHQPELQQDDGIPASTIALLAGLCHKYRTAAASIIMSTAPFSLPGLLQRYYQQRLSELSDVIRQQQQEQEAAMEGISEDVDAMSEDAAAMQSPEGSVGAQRLRSETPIGDPLLVLGQSWAGELSGVAAAMDILGLSAASEEAYTQVINRYVLQQLRSLASGELDSAVLPRAQRLVCAGPLEFLRLVLGGGQHVELKVQEWQLRLTYLMLETLGALRSTDMFNIVIDYPESAPALQDLAMCLQHTNMAGQFAATFKAALQQRLLHAGAATADIIHTYVSTIRAMKQLDTSGLLLDVVSEPIRAYLRSRADTIRCIVSMLTEDPTDATNGASGSSLLEELQEQQQQQGLGAGSYTPAHLGPKDSKYNWCVTEAEGDEAALRLLEALDSGPDVGTEQSQGATEQSSLMGLPVHSTPATPAALLSSGLGGRVDADVVSMLIGIYGGPLLFMEEYRNMLSDRLLAKDNYDCEREIRTLELLKIRFGEAGLHPCEVMLKDLADSKRLDANIRDLPRQQALQQQAVQKLPDHIAAALERTRATICSYLFWPELPDHDMVLPQDLKEAVQVYSERFRHLKAPRKLRWLPTVGLVELTLTIGDSEPLDFKVTPVHAALLMQFADDEASSAAAMTAAQNSQEAKVVSKTAAQLSTALGVPVPVVRKKAMAWVSAGVLVEKRGAAGEVTYSRATSIDPSRIVSREVTDMSWQEDTGASSTAEDRILAEMGPYENYVIGLLTNCGTLSIGRLHNMLRVFVVGEPKYEGKTQEQLAALLQIMVAKQKVVVSNGLYSRQKAT